jgi:Winged helix DNA-binding domain
VTPGEMEELVEAVAAILDGRVLSRDQLVTELVERLSRPELEEKLRSGWGSLLKPAAWQGQLCQGPPDGNRVTFARPDAWPGWRGLPDPSDAARLAIPAYLRAFGPAPMATFDAWLTRGLSRKPALRSWFAAVEDLLTTVEVDGEPAHLRAEDVDELVATPPTGTGTVRLLPAFDQYVLGPGTAAAEVVPPARRKEISKAAGWISPVVAVSDRGVVGVWEVADDRIAVRLFEEVVTDHPVPHDTLDAEAARLAERLGQPLTLAVTTA